MPDMVEPIFRLEGGIGKFGYVFTVQFSDRIALNFAAAGEAVSDKKSACRSYGWRLADRHEQCPYFSVLQDVT
jgi:hypothetical protein